MGPDYEPEEPTDDGYSILKHCEGDVVLAAELASSHLRAIRRLTAEGQRALAYADRAQQWADRQVERADQRITRHRAVLDTYYSDFPPAEGKTIELPDGSLQRRKNRALTEKSEPAALKFIREHLGTDGMATYLEPREPKIRWTDFNKGMKFGPNGVAVWAETGEIMEVELEMEVTDPVSGELVVQPVQVPVKLQKEPETPYTFLVETSPEGTSDD